MKQAIFNVVEREKLKYIHDTYFHPDSEHNLGFELFDSLHSADVISEEDFDMLEEIFKRIGDDLYKTIARNDKRILKENFK